MITSYLGIGLSRETIRDYNIPNLLHLVWLTFGATGLQVENLGYTLSRKDVTICHPDPTNENKKRPHRKNRCGLLILSLAVTYVPASFPAQYHRPGEA